jgi:ectoine hydroxylase-related dioxygenase (phytanoyl-CoA dioxygenase family)
MPFHDCPIELGSLQVLESSHRFGLQSFDPVTGIIPKGTVLGGDWVGGQINAGDVLVFHSLTVHAASPTYQTDLVFRWTEDAKTMRGQLIPWT